MKYDNLRNISQFGPWLWQSLQLYWWRPVISDMHLGPGSSLNECVGNCSLPALPPPPGAAAWPCTASLAFPFQRGSGCVRNRRFGECLPSICFPWRPHRSQDLVRGLPTQALFRTGNHVHKTCCQPLRHTYHGQ